MKLKYINFELVGHSFLVSFLTFIVRTTGIKTALGGAITIFILMYVVNMIALAISKMD